VSGFFDTATFATLAALAVGAQTQTTTFEYGPSGTTTGSAKITGACIVETFEVGSTTTDAVSLSMSLRKSGAVSNSTY
jgi:hypothetical protein